MAEDDDHCNKTKRKSHVLNLLQSKSPSDITRLLIVDVVALCGDRGPESDALRLAVDHRSKTQSWTSWACPLCSLTFPQPQTLSQHAVKAHARPNDQLISSSLMPKRVERDRVDSLLAGNWDPIEADPERSELLEGIRSAILKLVQFGILSCSQIDILLKIGGAAAAQSSALCFRSLTPSKLRAILTLLEGLIAECCSGIERTSSGSCNGSEEIEVERILVSGDGSKIVVSAKQFSRQSCVPDVDALVDWLYDDDGDDDEKGFFDWNELRLEKRNRGKEIFEKIQEELEQLETMCIKKHRCLRYRSAVVTLEKVFLDLVIKTGQGQESVMRKIRGDLSKRSGKDNDVLRHVAANVHKEAESLKASKMRNLVKLVKQEDNSTGEAFRKQLWDSDFEEAKCDARLLRKSIDIRQLEGELERASALDYLAVVVPLIKFFLRQRLEDETEPDGTDGSAKNTDNRGHLNTTE